MKAAVLLVLLAKNHALPDGNKRTALTCMVRFCLRNGNEYLPPLGDHPDGEETFQRMLAIAAAPAETWKPSKPRPPDGLPSGCFRFPRMPET
jgi:prophage maintenance system killer protein